MPCVRRDVPVVFGLAICLLSAGCAITRKSASIDSTSKMPWLGLELAPKRSEPAPETRRIKRDHQQPVEIEPAKLVVNGPQKKDTSWWQRLSGSEPRPVISLPRTDVVATPPIQKDADRNITASSETPEFW